MTEHTPGIPLGSWLADLPDERLIRGTLGTIRDAVKEAGITRTALILVGPALAGEGSDSRLYAPDHHHVLRPRQT